MISSITDALSPILPFAGGVDLRRDDAWKSWRSYLWIFGDSATSLSSRNGTTMMKGTKVPLVAAGLNESLLGYYREDIIDIKKMITEDPQKMFWQVPVLLSQE